MQEIILLVISHADVIGCCFCSVMHINRYSKAFFSLLMLICLLQQVKCFCLFCLSLAVQKLDVSDLLRDIFFSTEIMYDFLKLSEVIDSIFFENKVIFVILNVQRWFLGSPC